MTDAKPELKRLIGEIRRFTDKIEGHVGKREPLLIVFAGALGGLTATFVTWFTGGFGAVAGMYAAKALFD